MVGTENNCKLKLLCAKLHTFSTSLLIVEFVGGLLSVGYIKRKGRGEYLGQITDCQLLGEDSGL
jgi:hypothetical protein